jgi:hypothetical protein
MNKYCRFSWKNWMLVASSGSMLVVLGLAAACSLAGGRTSEIDSYDSAVRTQSVAESRAFVNKFRTSHLVGDLIESLPPQVALQVCEDLPFGTSVKARRSCENLRESVAAQPTAPGASIQLAASSPIVAASAASECVVVAPITLTSTDGKQPARAKPKAIAMAKTGSSHRQSFWQIALAQRGNKEVRN